MKGNNLKDSSTYGTRTVQVGEGSGSEDCMMGGSGRGGSVDSGHDGSDLAVTITAVVVGLVLGVRQAVAKMEVGIRS